MEALTAELEEFRSWNVFALSVVGSIALLKVAVIVVVVLMPKLRWPAKMS